MREVSVEGVVARSRVYAGSKSERDAVVLRTAAGREYILRRQGGPAFADPELDTLVGQRLCVGGLESGDTLIMRSWEPSAPG